MIHADIDLDLATNTQDASCAASVGQFSSMCQSQPLLLGSTDCTDQLTVDTQQDLLQRNSNHGQSPLDSPGSVAAIRSNNRALRSVQCRTRDVGLTCCRTGCPTNPWGACPQGAARSAPHPTRAPSSGSGQSASSHAPHPIPWCRSPFCSPTCIHTFPAWSCITATARVGTSCFLPSVGIENLSRNGRQASSYDVQLAQIVTCQVIPLPRPLGTLTSFDALCRRLTE